MERTIGLAILCFLLPPLAVALKSGLTLNLLLSLFLTVFGVWVLGVMHAVVVVLVLENQS